MVSRLRGHLTEQKEGLLYLEVQGITYEILIPGGVQNRLEEALQPDGMYQLTLFHYLQIDGARGIPVLVGFLNEIEREFFEKFIGVSGIGPRAAVKALNRPFASVARAVDLSDLVFLKSLPGIGQQKAKQIIAQLQGKVGKYALIPEGETHTRPLPEFSDFQSEALEVLLQLQYARSEAEQMIAKAMERNAQIQNVEELLNEVYKQKL